MIYNLWAMFVKVTQNRQGHTESVSSRYELLMIPSRMVVSGRKRSVKMAVSGRWKDQLRAAYERLNQWLKSTAPQLTLTSYRLPEWTLHPPPNGPISHPPDSINCGF